MSELSAKAADLIAFCRADGRICPQPQCWNRLWEMLPARKQKPSGGWEPSAPLILAAWWDTTGLEKTLRLRDHIAWADQHNSIDAVDGYLRSLSERQWFHGSD